MAERPADRQAMSGACADQVAPLQIVALGSRTVLRVKSWLPEYAGGARPVVLEGPVLENQQWPSQVGATCSGDVRILCIAPGDWLIIAPTTSPASLRERLEPELARYGLVLADLSDGYVAIEARGSAARELLSKACGLDFHPRSFTAGQCARTRFAQVAVVIECLDAPLRFELIVARSYGRYLQEWLRDAALELAGGFDEHMGRLRSVHPP